MPQSPVSVRVLVLAVAIIATGSSALAQPAASTPANGNKDPKPPRQPYDELKGFLNIVEDAYKAPSEVDQEVFDEIRKQYKNPSPDREAKIIREVRRLYVLTPEREAAILAEVRRSYERQTIEQEERIFREIRRGGQLPLGTITPEAQTELAARLFRKVDQDGNGSIVGDEMPESLRSQSGLWDRNLDGAISLEEYGPYFQASLKSVFQRVGSGELLIRAPRPAAPELTPSPVRVEEPRPAIARVGKLPKGLPDWFGKFDSDVDGQIGLYEWRMAGKPVEEFIAMDRNGDGLLEAAELLRFLAEQAPAKTSAPSTR